MSNIINFKIEIPDTNVKYIKDKSLYDHNYYYIGSYGDWYYGECDTVYQEFDECSNSYTNTLGYFEDDNFVRMFSWDTREDIFEGY